MLEKITAFLTGLLLMQMALYAHTEAGISKGNSANYSENLTAMVTNDADLSPMLDKLSIKTKIDENELEKKYPSAKIFTNPENGNATLTFYNPNDKNYRLDIYDINKGLVASFTNINTDHIVIERSMFEVGAYIYKLKGEYSSIYCGTFMLR